MFAEYGMKLSSYVISGNVCQCLCGVHVYALCKFVHMLPCIFCFCMFVFIYIYIHIYIYHCKLTYCSYNDMPFHNIFFRNYFDNIVINV